MIVSVLRAVGQPPRSGVPRRRQEAGIGLWLLIKKKKTTTCKTSTVSTKWKERALKPRCKYRIITSLCVPRPLSTGRRRKRTTSPQTTTHLREENMKTITFPPVLLLCRLGTCYHVKAGNVRPSTDTGLQETGYSEH